MDAKASLQLPRSEHVVLKVEFEPGEVELSPRHAFSASTYALTQIKGFYRYITADAKIE